ncbi:MAG TPA: ribbon-helix-helix protein, CopG family [Candidatus Kapabacteria bacterium]
MNTSILIRVDKEKKERFERMARRRGKTTSEVVRELMDEYIQKYDMKGYLSEVMKEIGDGLRRDGYTVDDVDKVIKEYKKEKRATT